MSHLPFGATRGFSVAAGTHTINLVCEEAFGDTAIGGVEVTAIFVGGASEPSLRDVWTATLWLSRPVHVGRSRDGGGLRSGSLSPRAWPPRSWSIGKRDVVHGARRIGDLTSLSPCGDANATPDLFCVTICATTRAVSVAAAAGGLPRGCTPQIAVVAA